MSLQEIIDNHIRKFLNVSFDWYIGVIQKTKKEFVGDFSINVFPIYRSLKTGSDLNSSEELKKYSNMSIEQFTNELSGYLKANVNEIDSINTIKGFINISLKDSFWIHFFTSIKEQSFGFTKSSQNSETVMIEFSSPNTNKPLHLGHVRNNLLGASLANILKASGKNVIRVNLVNDRGIHICKSMLAWKIWGKHREEPEKSGIKGDHLVGKYYVKFNRLYERELKNIEKLSNKEYIKRKKLKPLLSDLENRKLKHDSNLYSKALSNKKDTTIQSTAIGLMAAAIVFGLASSKKKNNWSMAGLGGVAAGLLAGTLYKSYRTERVDKVLKEELENNRNYYEKRAIEVKKIVKSLLKTFSKYQLNDKNEKEFHQKLRQELKEKSIILSETQNMLRQWEKEHQIGNGKILELWKKMNNWVYKGFEVTYKNLGVEFEKTYCESETYLLGKKIVEEGVSKGIFKKKEDGSIWVDLTADGLDEKLLLRSDGTSVYMTQDLGTAIERMKEFKVDKMIYVVGNEQDYHFKVLFLIIKKLIEQNAAGFGSLSFGESRERGSRASLFHLSYGMVDLPSGKMKSREGTVVDADELMDEMVNSARETTKALGKTDGMSDSEAETLYYTIGLGALKYFILKVDAKKRMLFDPKESIDFNGNTGPFIQYTYARIKSVLRKAKENQLVGSRQPAVTNLHNKEKSVIKLIHDFPKVISESAETYNPGHIANYVYDLVKEYNQFYHECPILKAKKEDEKNFRLMLSEKTSEVIKTSLKLLGIDVPERM